MTPLRAMHPSPSPRRETRCRGRRVAAWAAVVVVAVSCSDDGALRSPSQPPSSSSSTPIADPTTTAVDRREVVLDLSGDNSTDPPMDGLLSVALSDDGSRLFTLQTALDHSIVLRSFPYGPDARLSADDGFEVMRVPHPYFHSGGALAVDGRGDLLVSIGAFRRPGEPLGPQNPDGSIIRVPARFLTSPDDAPFVPTADDVVARGLRNPWRVTVDRATGDVWIGDVGESSAEEIDVIRDPRPGDEPVNFGWPYHEGFVVHGESPPGVSLVEPVWSESRRLGRGWAVIGGYVYRGRALPALVGWYVFTDSVNSEIRALPPGGDEAVTIGHPIDARFTSFGTDADGELLLVTASGDVHRLVPSTAPGAEGTEVMPVRIGSIWLSKPSDSASEATSVVAEPWGTGLLTSERGGLVMRVTPEPPASEACGPQLPELPTIDPLQTNVRDEIATVRRFLDRRAEHLPARFADDIETIRLAFDEFHRVGSSEGWESDELYDLVYATRIERGRHAGAQRAVATVNTYLFGICGDDLG